MSVVRLLALSTAWALAMIASAIINIGFLERTSDDKSLLLVAFIGLGAFIAFAAVKIALRWIPARWSPGQRFSFVFIALSLLTIGLTALIFALHFRAYFSQWHDDEFSMRLIFETVFTMLSAIYQFLVLGLRLYLPLGLVALLGASWALATKRI